MSYKKRIDVVIPYHGKDSDIIKMCIKSCVKNVQDIGNIYVVTSNMNLNIPGINLIDENNFFNEELSKKYIASKLQNRAPELAKSRTGWLFQQFIKMGSAYAIDNLSKHYLVVDADVIFLKKINFFENKTMLLTKGNEYHQPYFDCYQRLFKESANHEYSFVAHHMLISKYFMLEMLDKIAKNFNTKWYDAILDNLDSNQSCGFSEYETYGCYMKNHHSSEIKARKLKNIQKFKIKSILQILFNIADYASIHSYKKPENNPKTNEYLFNLFLKLINKKIYN